MRYKSKVVEKEAIQFTGKNLDEVISFCGDALEPIERRPDYELKIKTLEGTMVVSKYDFIIKGLKGEFYSCRPDIFEMSYEKIEN